jgi:hypothetical protein
MLPSSLARQRDLSAQARNKLRPSLALPEIKRNCIARVRRDWNGDRG